MTCNASLIERFWKRNNRQAKSLFSGLNRNALMCVCNLHKQFSLNSFSTVLTLSTEIQNKLIKKIIVESSILSHDQKTGDPMR